MLRHLTSLFILAFPSNLHSLFSTAPTGRQDCTPSFLLLRNWYELLHGDSEAPSCSIAVGSTNEGTAS